MSRDPGSEGMTRFGEGFRLGGRTDTPPSHGRIAMTTLRPTARCLLTALSLLPLGACADGPTGPEAELPGIPAAAPERR